MMQNDGELATVEEGKAGAVRKPKGTYVRTRANDSSSAYGLLLNRMCC